MVIILWRVKEPVNQQNQEIGIVKVVINIISPQEEIVLNVMNLVI